LAVVEQNDRLAVWRHLNRAQRNALGDHRATLTLQLRTVEADAHAVGALVDQPFAVEGIEQALSAKVDNLRAQYQLQARRAAVLGKELGGYLPCCAGGRGPVQRVVDGDGATIAMQTTEALAQHAGATAEYLRRLEPTRRRQVGSRALARLGEA